MSIIHEANSRIYIAGSTHPEQRERIRTFMHAAEDMGWVQTHPWLVEREAWEATGVPRTGDEIIRCAYADSIGVRLATNFVFLVPPKHIATNASVEFGIAIGAKVPNIALVGDLEDISCEFFSGLCACYPGFKVFDSDERAIHWLGEARLQMVGAWGTE